MHPDSARELKARILERIRSWPASPRAEASDGKPRIAVGLAPAGRGRARVAVRLADPADQAVLPDLGAAAGQLEVRVIGPIRALSCPTPGELRQRIRPLRPGLSVAHAAVSAGTLGGFVRWGGTDGRLAMLSNNHVLAAADAAALGEPVLQPGPADGGDAGDRVAALSAFERFGHGRPNLVDAAVAVLDPGIGAEPGNLPGGPLAGGVPAGIDIDPEEPVEKVGRTTGHTVGRVSAVEVDGVAVEYDQAVHTFDDQIEIEGRGGPFSERGDSGSVIWRSSDRAPFGLLFAGSTMGGTAGGGVTFANPLATVLAVLGVDWVSS